MRIKMISGLLAILLFVSSLCSCTQLAFGQETDGKQETEAKQGAEKKKETETKKETEAPHVHVYGEWKTAKAPCLSDGLKYRSCSCGETEQQTVAVTGHISEKGKCSQCGLDFFTELASLILKYGEVANNKDYCIYSELDTYYEEKVIKVGILYEWEKDTIEISFRDDLAWGSEPFFLFIIFDRYMFENYEYQWSATTKSFESAEGTFSAPTFSYTSRFSHSSFDCSEGKAGSIAQNATSVFRDDIVDFFRSFISKSDQGLALVDYGFERLK